MAGTARAGPHSWIFVGMRRRSRNVPTSRTRNTLGHPLLDAVEAPSHAGVNSVNKENPGTAPPGRDRPCDDSPGSGIHTTPNPGMSNVDGACQLRGSLY